MERRIARETITFFVTEDETELVPLVMSIFSKRCSRLRLIFQIEEYEMEGLMNVSWQSNFLIFWYQFSMNVAHKFTLQEVPWLDLSHGKFRLTASVHIRNGRREARSLIVRGTQINYAGRALEMCRN